MTVDYQANGIVTLADMVAVLARHLRPVLLLEGIRALPEADRAKVIAVGRMLAERLPDAVFRSGNAEGSDTAFAEGVVAVDPTRMEYVITHGGMGRKRRKPHCRAVALAEVPCVGEGPVGEYTVVASPGTKGLVDAYQTRGRSGALGAKAAYLLRDTLKVVGSLEAGLAPAVVGLFYVNEADPFSGGTGHTLRVCLAREVPVVFQTRWRTWASA
jgi:hypothetical protein